VINNINMPSISVSVIIVAYKSSPTLHKCLRAVSQQTIEPNNVIVIDNYGLDNIDNILDQFSSINIKYIKLNTNIGFAAANNLAVQFCNTEFVALLNPDAYPSTDWLANLVFTANINPHAASFGSLQLIENRIDTLDGIGDVYHFTGLAWREGHDRKQLHGNLYVKEIFSPCAAAALYRRNAFNQVGGFDDNYFCYFEDVDLGFRLRLAGWTSLFVPNAVVKHVGGASAGGRRTDFSLYYGHRNMVWTFVKNMPGCLFYFFLIPHIILNIITIIWFIFKGKGRIICKSKFHAFLELPKIFKKRYIIQKERKVSTITILKVMKFAFIR